MWLKEWNTQVLNFLPSEFMEASETFLSFFLSFFFLMLGSVSGFNFKKKKKYNFSTFHNLI